MIQLFIKIHQFQFTLEGGADTLRWWWALPASLTQLSDGWCIRDLRLLVDDTKLFSDPDDVDDDELASWRRKRAFSRSVICRSTGAARREAFTDAADADAPEDDDADPDVSDAFLRSFLPFSSLPPPPPPPPPKASPTWRRCCKYLWRQSSQSKYHELPYLVN